MEDVEVMKQLRTMITEWNAVDELLIPAKFDILLRCSDMEQNLDVHCFRHCVEHKRAMCACSESRQFQILMQDCHMHAQYVWGRIGNDQPVRVMCISHDVHWAQAFAARLHAVYTRESYISRGPFHISGPDWNAEMCRSWKRQTLGRRADEIIDRGLIGTCLKCEN